MILLPCIFLSNVNNINIHLRFSWVFLVLLLWLHVHTIFFQTFMTLLNILLKYSTYTSQILSLIISYRLNTPQQPQHRLKWKTWMAWKHTPSWVEEGKAMVCLLISALSLTIHLDHTLPILLIDDFAVQNDLQA